MRKLLYFFMIAGLWLPAITDIALAQDKDGKHELPSYGELEQLEKQTVKNYEGYKISATWFGQKPAITITQEQVRLPKTIVNLKAIAEVDPETSAKEQLENQLQLTGISNIKTANIKPIDREGDILRFDLVSNDGKVRMSEWRNINNGFSVQTVLFTDNGKLLNVVFYHRLKINEKFSNPFLGGTTVAKLDNAISILGKFDTENLDSTKDFCLKLLKHILHKAGIDDAENDQ
jgi:hypothetical protein